MGSLRTPEMEQKYIDYRKDGHMNHLCNICEKAPIIKEFKLWKIVGNLFPWDRVAKIQHMVVPKRHVVYEELSGEEKREFDEIKVGYIEKEYEIIAEATNKIKTIPSHFHMHLIVMKD
jgi:hypothetical protein